MSETPARTAARTPATFAQSHQHGGGTLLITLSGRREASVRIVLLHGWGQPGSSLLPLVTTLQREAEIIALDTPGNGVAPLPPGAWGIADYVALVESWLATLPAKPTLFVCHSFGARLAMRIAARELATRESAATQSQAQPGCLRGIVVVGGHGLKPVRPLLKRLKIWTLVRITKLLGRIDRSAGTGLKASWAARIGSADYKNAGAFRAVFVRIVGDDVAPLLPRVMVPVLLLYGERDSETPPAMGARYHKLLPRSEFHVLPGLDHYTVLTHGAGLVQTYLREFLQKVMPC